MTVLHPEMYRRLREVTLSLAEREVFARRKGHIHALAMTEDWCVDA